LLLCGSSSGRCVSLVSSESASQTIARFPDTPKRASVSLRALSQTPSRLIAMNTLPRPSDWVPGFDCGGKRIMGQTQSIRIQDPADLPLVQGLNSNVKSKEEQVSRESQQEISWRVLLHDSDRGSSSLQGTLRTNLADAILEGRIPESTRLPSTRALSSLLKVARITVSMVYDALEAQG
jgi:hypothetical protein